MSVLIFSLEGWIMSIIGLAWRAIRNSVFPISYLEDYILYVQLAISSLNIFFCAIFNDKRPTVASYFTLTFNLWLFTLMVGADSWDEYTLDNWNTNITVSNTTCCPNNKYYAWTRQVYFAGSPLYLAPLAVTFALQTIQVCISAGALSNLQNTLYTGIAQGYSLLTFAMFYFLCKVSGPFTLACMDDSLKLFDSLISIKLKYVLITLAASTLVWGVAEELIQPAKVRFLWMLVGFFLITIYMTFVLLNFWGYNMISIPFLILHGVACIPIFYTFIEILNPNLKIIENSINERIKQKSTKFVLPINTTLSNSKASKTNNKND